MHNIHYHTIATRSIHTIYHVPIQKLQNGVSNLSYFLTGSRPGIVGGPVVSALTVVVPSPVAIDVELTVAKMDGIDVGIGVSIGKSVTKGGGSSPEPPSPDPASASSELFWEGVGAREGTSPSPDPLPELFSVGAGVGVDGEDDVVGTNDVGKYDGGGDGSSSKSPTSDVGKNVGVYVSPSINIPRLLWMLELPPPGRKIPTTNTTAPTKRRAEATVTAFSFFDQRWR